MFIAELRSLAEFCNTLEGILAFYSTYTSQNQRKIYARRFNHFLCGPPQWQVQKKTTKSKKRVCFLLANQEYLHTGGQFSPIKCLTVPNNQSHTLHVRTIWSNATTHNWRKKASPVSIKRFHDYMFGRHFKLVADHKPVFYGIIKSVGHSFSQTMSISCVQEYHCPR